MPFENVTLRVNGAERALRVEPRCTLLDALRLDLGLTGAKKACDMGNCGACTVLLDGRAVYACLLLAVDCAGREIATVEGLDDDPLQKAFIVSLEELFSVPTEERRSETTLRDGELFLEVSMPSHPEQTRSVYLKEMDRQAFAFALVSAAAVVRLSSSHRIGHVRLVLGGVAPIPWRAYAAERVL